jgi:hypothetical protein
MASWPVVKTRILIISDTHGSQPYAALDEGKRQCSSGNGRGEGDDDDDCATSTGPDFPKYSDDFVHRYVHAHGFRQPLPSADVAVHCGDLTKGSRDSEYRDTFDMLRKIDAPLKLVIAGNHDLCLDPAFWDGYVGWGTAAERERKARYPELARQIIDGARADGVLLLDEGSYEFVLANGARLKVFASPWTPAFGSWAFQYRGPHCFEIPPGTDLAMTHGPPHGLLDTTFLGDSAGCGFLLHGVARARPRVHCFGHIHEAWGAKLVTWADPGAGATVDAAKTVVLEDLASLEPLGGDDAETVAAKAERRRRKARDRCSFASLCAGDAHALEYGKQTLFVNAAIMNTGYRPHHLPWLIDLELPRAAGDREGGEDGGGEDGRVDG